MKKEKARDELIIPKLQSGEELIGFFQAQYTPSWGWYFLIGPLFAFAIRIYFVAVTDKGIHYHKLTFFGKPDTSNYFTWNEIEKVKLSKGLLQAPLKFKDLKQKICQACLSRFFVLGPLDCKDRIRTFPKREARERRHSFPTSPPHGTNSYFLSFAPFYFETNPCIPLIHD